MSSGSSSGGIGRERLQNKNQYTYMGQTGFDAPLQDLAANMADKLKQSSAMSNLAFGGPGFSGSFNTPAGAAPDPQTKGGSFNPFGGDANPFKTNQGGPSSQGGSPAPGGAPANGGNTSGNGGAPLPGSQDAGSPPPSPAGGAPPTGPTDTAPGPANGPPAKPALPPPSPVGATKKTTVGMRVKAGDPMPDDALTFKWVLDPATGEFVANDPGGTKSPAQPPPPSGTPRPSFEDANGVLQPGPGI